MDDFCAKNKNFEKCHTLDCSFFKSYFRQSLPCANYVPEDRGYDGRFWEREGRIIRRQYFNGFIAFFLYIFVLIIFILAVDHVMETVVHSRPSRNIDMGEIFFPMVVFIFPFLVLSIANRFFFGRRVCLINEEGLYCNEMFVPWHKIQEMTHAVPEFSDKYAYAHIIQDDLSYPNLFIPHAPRYLLRAAKKYNCDIKTKSNLLNHIVISLVILVVVTLIIFIRA